VLTRLGAQYNQFLPIFPNPLDGPEVGGHHWQYLSDKGVGMLYLAAVGEKGNEAFLGIGVIGWIIIIVLVAAAIWFVRGRRA
jgi:hypothetical protein